MKYGQEHYDKIMAVLKKYYTNPEDEVKFDPFIKALFEEFGDKEG